MAMTDDDLRADRDYWRDAHALADAERVKAEGRARRAEEQRTALRKLVLDFVERVRALLADTPGTSSDSQRL